MGLKNAIIIGCGSLGGYIAKELTEKKFKIKLIDHDVVETRNIEQSIFDFSDVGRLKVEALRDILMYPYVEIYPQKFEDIDINILKNFWVVNCTDMSLIRHNRYVDVKCCISENFLILDSRKQQNETFVLSGKYINKINNFHIHMASKFIARFMASLYHFDKFVQSRSYVTIPLNELATIKFNELVQRQETEINHLYDHYDIFHYIKDLPKLIKKIVDNPHKENLCITFNINQHIHEVFLIRNEQYNFHNIALKINDNFFKEYKKEEYTGLDFLISNKINKIYSIIPVIGGA